MIINFKDCGYFNYYHWLIYMLSNLRYYDNSDPTVIYTPLPDNESFQHESLKILYPNTILKNSRYESINSNEFVWNVPQCPPTQWRGSGVDHGNYKFLREKFMDSAEKTEDHEYIYISRKLNSLSPGHPNIEARHIRNEDQMMEVLKPLGFKQILLENMSFKKQMGIFKYAKIIISPHGTALVNSCFASENTHIIEVAPSPCDWQHFSDICETFSIPYTRFNKVYNWDHEYNMEINVDEILKFIYSII